MSKCPKCDGDIEYLLLLETKEEEYSATYDKEGETLEFEKTEEWTGNPTGKVLKEEYSCPKCHVILFTDEEDAKAFFSGIKIEPS